MRFPLPEHQGQPLRRVHCIGIAGMGLGPLAIYLAGLGCEVSGEDDSFASAMRPHLFTAGIRLGGMDAATDLLVVSSAVPSTHPTRLQAEHLGIPVLRRGALLACLASKRRLIAVCGSHGKTSTTAMMVHAFQRTGRHPGYILGGLFNASELPPAAVGGEDWLIAEIDESDGTIADFSPEITVLTNLDWDHPDQYACPARLNDAFGDLFARTQDTVLVPSECPETKGILHRALRTASYGEKCGNYSFSVQSESVQGLMLELSGAFPHGLLPVAAQGRFNARNATAALAALSRAGVSVCSQSLADYPGVQRRQATLSADEPFTVIEDYAHHPAEIEALLTSLRAGLPHASRLHVVFQPHRYSRTAHFKNAFARSLALADEVHLLEVYAAGEARVAGGEGVDLYNAFPSGFPVQFHGKFVDACFSALSERLHPGDLLAVIGAGDVDQAAKHWLASRRWDRWFARLAAEGFSTETRLTREEPLAQRSTMRVGGSARVYAEPCGTDDLRTLLRCAKRDQVPVHLLGRGSNLLIPDEGVDGLVISLNHPSWASFEARPDGRLWVGAGLRLKNLCGLAAARGLAGFEFLEGIPGGVGGSLRMNAGAMGGWIFDVVDEVLLMSLDGELQTLTRAELGVDYRQCLGLEHAVALGALFRPVAPSDAKTIGERLDACRCKRLSSQPREPSAGCIFRNPPGDSAGRLIDACGLKGLKQGAAMVSPIHANFIVNTGGATATDVLRLLRQVRAAVRAQTGVELHPEVRLFGKSWAEVL